MGIACDYDVKLPVYGRGSVQVFELAGKLIVADKGFEHVGASRLEEIARYIFAREQRFADKARSLESLRQKVSAQLANVFLADNRLANSHQCRFPAGWRAVNKHYSLGKIAAQENRAKPALDQADVVSTKS